ncbi:FecR family protein [Henriciella aquimarina]|uniref:FecR family protein n=1 Tax=Henriciella aquimarina TaxID=545261 RepID=UPI001301AED8|nr:FecR domain-containing protein [Henriciella aquimarina]
MSAETIQSRDDIGEAADSWAQRMASGSLTAEEARAFNQWVSADPAHEAEFQAAQALRKELPHLRHLDQYSDWLKPPFHEWAMARVMVFAKALMAPFRGRGGLRAIGGGLAVASLAVAMLAIFLSSSAPVDTPDLVTEIAEVRDVTLPDGSVVTIGAASSLSVDYTAHERRVSLSEGEAYFDVKSNPDRPFIVVANNTVVRVRGTKFDVSLETEAVSIAVSEGRVEVIQPEAVKGAIRDKDIKHVLLAGQQVSAPKTGQVQPVRPIKAEDVASWRRGDLTWVDTPIKDIIADLDRYLEEDIELQASDVADLEYTLAVQADDLPAALDLIAASLDLQIEEKDGGVVVLR